MANAFDGANSLGLYHTGAHHVGGSQYDPAACLGGERSGIRMKAVSALIEPPKSIPELRVDFLTAANGEGLGFIAATDDDILTYTGPGDASAGAPVTILNGEQKLLEGLDTDKAVLVAREGSTAFPRGIDAMELNCKAPFNPPLALGDVGGAEQTAGSDKYRGSMFRNDGASAVTNLKVWVEPLGDQITSNTAQLPASGAGAIETTDPISADTPQSGAAHIKTIGGATKEVIYYEGWSGSTFTVPASGRGMFGTTPTLGASDDTVDFVSMIELSFETPAADGTIQAIADEDTAPSSPAPSWDFGCTEATGLSLSSLASGATHGLWVHRQIPAGATATPYQHVKVRVKWTYSAVDYEQVYHGIHSIADDSLSLYLHWLGEDADPDLTADPDNNSATLPFNTALAAPPSGERDYRDVVRLQNKYGLRSGNLWPGSTIIDSAGLEVGQYLRVPTGVTLSDSVGGEVRIEADYARNEDADPADTWNIYIRTDGTNPDPLTDTPVTEAIAAGGTRVRLSKALGPYGQNTDLRVRLSVERTSPSSESAASATVTLVVGNTGPAILTRRSGFYGDLYGQAMSPPTINETVDYDVPLNVRAIMTPGVTDLMFGATLIFRAKYDSLLDELNASGVLTDEQYNNGIWTLFGIDQTAISGAAGASPVDVVSATEGYLAVDGIRRLKIDVTNSLLSFAALDGILGSNVVSVQSANPIEGMVGHTAIQVWDRHTFDLVTVASVDSAGIMHTKIPWNQVNNVGDIL